MKIFRKMKTFRSNKRKREKPAIADDLLRGAEAIAKFLYGEAKQRRKVYHLAATNGIPSFNLGAIVCARKSTLLEWIRAQEKRGRNG